MRNAVVLLPPGNEFRSVFEFLVQPGLHRAGYEAELVPTFEHKRGSIAELVRAVGAADFAVADLTALHPGVLYELGVCHAIGIPTLLIAQSIDDVPPDLRGYRIELYSTRFDQAHQLSRALTGIASELAEGTLLLESPVWEHLVGTPMGRRLRPDGSFRGELMHGRPAEVPMAELVSRIESSTEQVVSITARITADLEMLLERTHTLGSELTEFSELPSSELRAARRRLANRSASELTTFSEAAEAHRNELAMATDRLLDAGSLFASAMKHSGLGASPELRHYQQLVSRLLDVVVPSNERVKWTIGEVSDVLGDFSPQVGRALDRTRSTLGDISGLFETLRAFGERTADLLSEIPDHR